VKTLVADSPVRSLRDLRDRGLAACVLDHAATINQLTARYPDLLLHVIDSEDESVPSNDRRRLGHSSLPLGAFADAVAAGGVCRAGIVPELWMVPCPRLRSCNLLLVLGTTCPLSLSLAPYPQRSRVIGLRHRSPTCARRRRRAAI
jgi:hypothetical protein